MALFSKKIDGVNTIKILQAYFKSWPVSTVPHTGSKGQRGETLKMRVHAENDFFHHLKH
jgi:hypothetical protein